MVGNKKSKSIGNLKESDVEEIHEESTVGNRKPQKVDGSDNDSVSIKADDVKKRENKEKLCRGSINCVSIVHIILVGICLYGIFYYYTQFSSLNAEVIDKPSIILIVKMVVAGLLAIIISISRAYYLDKCD